MTIKEISSLFSAIATMSGKTEGSQGRSVHLRGNVRMICAWNLSVLHPIVSKYQEQRKEKMAELAESCKYNLDNSGQKYDQEKFSKELAAWEKEAADTQINVDVSQCRKVDLDLDNNPEIDHVTLFNLAPMLEDWSKPESIEDKVVQIKKKRA
jgi:hypothetical protein